MVHLDPDVAAVFRSPEAVNRILRAIISAFPSAGGPARDRGFGGGREFSSGSSRDFAPRDPRGRDSASGGPRDDEFEAGDHPRGKGGTDKEARRSRSGKPRPKNKAAAPSEETDAGMMEGDDELEGFEDFAADPTGWLDEHDEED